MFWAIVSPSGFSTNALFFALAAAICLRIFVAADHISSESVQLNRAVLAAQSGAESFKAAGGDLNEAADILRGHFGDVTTESSPDGSGALTMIDRHIVEITRGPNEGGYIEGEVSVRDLSGRLIFAIPVAVLEVAR